MAEKVIMDSAYKNIGLKAVGMNGKSWLTREVKEEVKKRDVMRR